MKRNSIKTEYVPRKKTIFLTSNKDFEMIKNKMSPRKDKRESPLTKTIKVESEPKSYFGNYLEEIEKKNSPNRLNKQNTFVKKINQVFFLDNDNPQEEVKSTRIRVIGRFRPLNFLEEELSNKKAGKICVEYINNNTVMLNNNNTKQDFTLDGIYDSNTSQETLYNEVVSETIKDTLNGFNGTVFTYGQSGSGKTYTMFGTDIYNTESRGIIPRAIEQIFDHIEQENNNNLYEIKFSILEIYKEKLRDLLNPSIKFSDLKIKENPKTGIFVDNLTSIAVEEREEVYAILEQAEENRNVAETKLNQLSSRSHIVFMLSLQQKLQDNSEKVGVLNLVDLAGSEKVSKTGAIGETLEEAKKINSSLTCLGNVINALTSGKGEFVPYRDSKLTRLLKDSLGGNFKTTLIVTCSPHSFNVEETISTLNFAKRTKNVQNKVKANIKKSPEEFEKIIERLEEKIKELTEENNRLYSGPTSPSIRRDGYCESNKDIKEVLVKEKEEEKLKIKEEIDNLKTEKEDLEKEVKRMKNDLNLGKTIETLEKSFRNNVNDMENMILKYQTQTEGYYKEELLKLKEKLVMKQGSEIDKIKDLISNQKEFKDFKNNFQQINKNVKDFLENNLNCFQKENDITLSDDTFPRKSFLNELLQDFICKSNIFNNDAVNSKEKDGEIVVNKKKYLELKTSFLQYIYNNLDVLNDLLENFSVDKKIHQFYQKYSQENFLSIERMKNNMINYLEIIDEIRSLYINSTPNKPISANCLISKEPLQSNEIQFRKKFLRRAGKKSCFRTKYNILLKNVIRGKLGYEKSTPFNARTINAEEKDIPILKFDSNEDSLEDLESQKKEKGLISAPKYNYHEIEISPFLSNKGQGDSFQQDRNDYRTLPPLSGKLKFDSKYNIMNRLRNKNMKSFGEFMVTPNIKTELNTSNRDLYSGSILLRQEDLNELFLLRKEKIMNSQMIKDLTKEVVDMQLRVIEWNKSVQENQRSVEKVFHDQTENLKKTLKIIRNFYNEEIIYANNVITELSNLIDDILINEKPIKNKKNKHLNNFFLNKRNMIIKKEINEENPNIVKFAEAFINDSGTATKKLDYLYIDLKNKMEISYGSGLSKKIPSKCPLMNNLQIYISGDLDDDILIPE